MSNRPSLPALLALATVGAGALLAVKPAGGADAAAQASAPAAHTARHGPTARPGSDLTSLYATLAAKRFVDLTHRSEEHTSELQSQSNLVCRLLLEKTK